MRRRRGRAIAAANAGLAEWRAKHPGEHRRSPEAFAPIRAGIAKVKLSEIMAVTGLSKSTASQIRSGRVVPHARHWLPLSRLAEIEPMRQ